MRRLVRLLCALAILLDAGSAIAQDFQSDFPPDEFRARWTAVFDRIGTGAVAVLQGMPRTDGFIFPRQSNSFYYLSGIETPGSYLLLDGRTRKATLYLPPRNAALEAAEGKVLSADDGEIVKRLTGVDEVRSVDVMAANWPLGAPPQGDGATAAAPPIIFAEFSPPEGAGQSRGELVSAEAARANDAWDGGTSRQQRFTELLRVRNPRAEIRNLNPLLDELRSVKSPREIALIRRASQLAGLGVMEAIRSAKAGVYEYQLDAAARYVFLLHGARLEGYRSITASGTDNINNMHYYRNLRTLQDGDLVLMDYAPEYRYYTSDIGRVWPVNGTYAPWQRELLQFVLDYRNAVLTRVRPGVTATQILDEARKAMEPIFARTKFSKPIYEAAARRLVDTSGGAFSHTVGMAVHDVGSYRAGPLRPGQVFSIDPQLRVPEEHLYLRYEDTIVVTANGYENFTDFLPTELDDLEKLARGTGVVQKVPPIPDRAIGSSGRQ